MVAGLSEDVMGTMSDDEKRRAFQKLHDPSRPIFHIGHARRGNSAEEYNSSDIRNAGERLLGGNMKTAQGVIEHFGKHSAKKKD